VFIRVNPWFQIWSKKIAESVPSQGVVLGRKRSAALHDGATGGMSADILLAHSIAAAKVRPQSQEIRCGIIYEPSRKPIEPVLQPVAKDEQGRSRSYLRA
jgi:hypothetical protein